MELLVILPVLVSAIAQCVVEWRRDPAAVIKTGKLFAVYMLHVVAVIPPVLFLADRAHLVGGGLATVSAIVVFAVSWIFFGALWLARLVPRRRELPRWIGERMNWTDHTLLAVALASLVYAVS